MDFNILVIGLIGLVSIAFFVFKLYTFKKDNPDIPTEEVIINKIRPFLIQLLADVVEAGKHIDNYDEFEDYCVNFIDEKLKDSSVLTVTEKEILNKELIRETIKPFIVTVWKQKDK